MELIAITGGTGFIGKCLVSRHLEKGDRVRLLSRSSAAQLPTKSVERHVADMANGNKDALERFVDGVDVLYHCAGEILNESRMDALNVNGTERLASVAAGRIGRWVQLSTIGVYGFPRTGIVTENTPPSPANKYECSKLGGDYALLSIAQSKNMPWSILRPSIVFGNDMPNNSLRSLIRAIRSGRFFYIGLEGALLPYVHIDDVVEALMLCGVHEKAQYQIFNLSDDVSVEEFVRETSRLIGCRAPSWRLPENPIRMAAFVMKIIPDFPLTTSRVNALTRRVSYPIDKIRDELGYELVRGWRDGLRKMVGAKNGDIDA